MKKLLLPLILLLLGIGGGVGAGLFVKPAAGDDHPTDQCAATADQAEMAEHATEIPVDTTEQDATTREYVRLNNQFIVPVLRDAQVVAMVVLAISVEVQNGTSDQVFAAEPRLRDSFLQVLFDHANLGGFDGNFTSASNMQALRANLLRSARDAVGTRISDVLIMDIVRQDI